MTNTFLSVQQHDHRGRLISLSCLVIITSNLFRSHRNDFAEDHFSKQKSQKKSDVYG